MVVVLFFFFFFFFFKLTLNRWPCSRCRSYKNNEEHEYYVNRLILQILCFGFVLPRSVVC